MNKTMFKLKYSNFLKDPTKNIYVINPYPLAVSTLTKDTNLKKPTKISKTSSALLIIVVSKRALV